MLRYLILICSLGLLLSSCLSPSTPSKPLSSPQIQNKKTFTDITIDKTLAQSGELYYEQNCKFCHQADAIGKPGVAPSLTNKEFLSLASNRFLVSTILDGRPGTGMPPFSHIGEEKAKAIVAYIRSFEKIPSRVAKVETQKKATGDIKSGEKLFKSICLSCHGPLGNGYRAGGTGTAIGLPGFLSKASDGFIRTTIKEGRSNTRMRGFNGPQGLANLSHQQIDDIIVYLRSLAK